VGVVVPRNHCNGVRRNCAGRDFADSARGLQSAVDWNATTDEERIGLLRLAEVYAYVAPEETVSAFASYEAVSAKMDSQRMASSGTDPRLAGWETYVRGLVARSSGDPVHADAHLRAAVGTFRSCGYLWREAFALIELDATPAETRGNAYLEMAARIIQDNFPRSFLAHRLGPWARMYFDPIASTLTPAQRDVLRHLLGGLNPREIAERTNRAPGTVEHHVKRLHAAFGTHSVGQLFHECNRRGIGVPTWRMERSRHDGPFGWVERG
jgi:DNA-binding CsgD family transcriptional regulator